MPLIPLKASLAVQAVEFHIIRSLIPTFSLQTTTKMFQQEEITITIIIMEKLLQHYNPTNLVNNRHSLTILNKIRNNFTVPMQILPTCIAKIIIIIITKMSLLRSLQYKREGLASWKRNDEIDTLIIYSYTIIHL